MPPGPVKHQVDQRRAVAPVKGSGPELDPSFGEPVIPQPTTIVGTLEIWPGTPILHKPLFY